jgi:hypothetical protein
MSERGIDCTNVDVEKYYYCVVEFDELKAKN